MKFPQLGLWLFTGVVDAFLSHFWSSSLPAAYCTCSIYGGIWPWELETIPLVSRCGDHVLGLQTDYVLRPTHVFDGRPFHFQVFTHVFFLGEQYSGCSIDWICICLMWGFCRSPLFAILCDALSMCCLMMSQMPIIVIYILVQFSALWHTWKRCCTQILGGASGRDNEESMECLN